MHEDCEGDGEQIWGEGAALADAPMLGVPGFRWLSYELKFGGVVYCHDCLAKMFWDSHSLKGMFNGPVMD